jgi:hypothetical protein
VVIYRLTTDYKDYADSVAGRPGEASTPVRDGRFSDGFHRLLHWGWLRGEGDGEDVG